MFWTHLNPLEPPKPPKKSKKVIFRDLKIRAGVLKVALKYFLLVFGPKFFFRHLQSAIWAASRPLLIIRKKPQGGAHCAPPYKGRGLRKFFGPKTNRKYFRATFRNPAPIFRSLKMIFLLFLGGFGGSKGFKYVQNIKEYKSQYLQTYFLPFFPKKIFCQKYFWKKYFFKNIFLCIFLQFFFGQMPYND